MTTSDLNLTRKYTPSQVIDFGYLLVNFQVRNFLRKCFITKIFLKGLMTI